MPRNSRITRVLRCSELLSHASGISLDDLAAELGVSARTARRDVEALEEAHLPIEEVPDSEPKRLRLHARWASKAGFEPTLPELLALQVACPAARNRLGPLSRALDSVVAKLRAAVPAELREQVAELAGLGPSGPQAVVADAGDDWLTLLADAVQRCRELLLDYESRSRRGRGARRVEPHAVIPRRSGAYLVARDVLHDDMRTYALTRILGVKATGRSFARSRDFDPARFRADSFGIHDGEPQQVRIRFSASAAGHVREHPAHASQLLTVLPSGEVELVMRVGGLLEVKSWVQGYGSAAEVLEPRELADAVAEDARTVWARHARTTRSAAPAPVRGRGSGGPRPKVSR